MDDHAARSVPVLIRSAPPPGGCTENAVRAAGRALEQNQKALGLNERRNQQVAYELAAASSLDVGAVGVQTTCNR